MKPDSVLCDGTSPGTDLQAQPSVSPAVREALYKAAISCPHEIDGKTVTLHFDPKQAGHNALAQLANRLEEAQARGAARSALALQEEPVAWEYRTWMSGGGGEPVGWSVWERLMPRNRYTDSIQDRVREIQDYAARGYKYELRALYAHPPEPQAAQPVKALTDDFADVEHNAALHREAFSWATKLGYPHVMAALAATPAAFAASQPVGAASPTSDALLYLQLTDAMGYSSGKDGMEFSPEEWAAALLKDAKAWRAMQPVGAARVPTELCNKGCEGVLLPHTHTERGQIMIAKVPLASSPQDREDALRKALNAMLTHSGMDEDEWSKPTFDQARAALAFTAHGIESASTTEPAPGTVDEMLEWIESMSDDAAIRNMARAARQKASTTEQSNCARDRYEGRAFVGGVWQEWHPIDQMVYANRQRWPRQGYEVRIKENSMATTESALKWCNACGEGVTTFCRGKSAECPMFRSATPAPAMAAGGVPLLYGLKPLEGLAQWLREQAVNQPWQGEGSNAVTIRRWADEVEAARPQAVPVVPQGLVKAIGVALDALSAASFAHSSRADSIGEQCSAAAKALAAALSASPTPPQGGSGLPVAEERQPELSMSMFATSADYHAARLHSPAAAGPIEQGKAVRMLAERCEAAEQCMVMLTADHNSGPHYARGFDMARRHFAKYPNPTKE